MKATNLLRSLLLGLVAVLLAIPVFAAGPLANCQSGVPYRWAAGGANIPFNPDQGDLGPLVHAAAVATVQGAFDVWQGVGTSTVSYVNAGELPVDVTIANWVPYYDAPAPDGLSAIVFDDTGQIFNFLFGAGSGILGFAGPEWGVTSTCTITEGLSFLNGPAFTDLTYASDVMVHEFGHYTNLAHTVVNGQIYLGGVGGDHTGPSPYSPYPAPNPMLNDVVETMYPYYYGPGIGMSSLEADDVAAVSAIYPDASFSPAASIRGAVLLANGSTRLSGVNVIARNEADPFHDAVSAISGDWTDSTAQSDPRTGTYTLYGLTPGASYRVYVDRILAGGFSTSPVALPGPEEYYSGAAESNNGDSDPPSGFALVSPGASGANVIFNAPRPGERLAVGEDGFVQLPLPFPFAICGQTFDAVFVNANGNLTFGSGDTDYTETAAELLNDQPRVAGLWDDLSPFNLSTGAPQGTVTFAQSRNAFSVAWANVPEYPNNGSNSFTITLRHGSNLIDIQYGSMTARDGIAGVSCGGAVTSRSETPSDLSLLAAEADDRINLHSQPAVFEVFATASPNDLAGLLLPLTGTTTYDDEWAGPNDDLAHARAISLPFDSASTVRYTEISPIGGDVDFFSFSASQGDVLLAEVVAGALDSMLVVADAAGNVIAFDDDAGAGVLSLIVTALPASGTYYLGVTAYPDFAFTGAGTTGGRYVLRVAVNASLQLPLTDDSSIEMPLGFGFPFQGTTRSTVWVNSNGNLTFGSGDTDLSETVAEFLSDQPRIAALWDDLNPARGSVTASWSPGAFTVSYNAPEFGSTAMNAFAITLRSGGRITVSYGTIAANDAIVGVSPGGGAPNPGEVNLGSAVSWPAVGVTYEQFTGTADPVDLDDLVLEFNP